ncbi:MAG: hypothetical protein JXR94_18610, partial [Candidatus Hydrogenedentes bacterium]|nr:hypothetical protein [Candidatus Hydrogenedentota bacterium]
FYYVTNPNNLPQIFTKEAAVVKRALLYEEPFIPKALHDSEILRGVSGNGFPTLKGYVVTTPKDNATVPLVSPEGDPVLAHWRYGLGKSVAFTSDVTTRWAADWVKWEGFNRFWAQAVRWAVRDLAPGNFRVETRIKDAMGYVKIDAVDDQGHFVNFLRPRGVVSGPAPDFERTELALSQTGPGIYEGRFPATDRGVYMLTLTYDRPDGSHGMIPAGLAVNYSKEYEYNVTNHGLIDQLAETGGGKVLETGTNPFQHDLELSPTVTSIWQFLAALALCLFPLEIFIRRVVVDFSAVFGFALKLVRKLPGLRRLIPAPKPRAVPVTGSYSGMSRPSRSMVFTASGTTLPGGAPRPVDDGTAPAGEAPETPAATLESQAPGHSEYTRQLLAAKQRALAKHEKRRSGPPDSGTGREKENP